MLNRFTYHKSLETLHLGCEEPRAYFIPYENREKAIEDNREKSGFFKTLCGEWDFLFCKDESCLGDFLAEDFAPAYDRVEVPRNWQTYLGRGYDVPNYTNINYPYPCDPPRVPFENPLGLYRRYFTLSKKQLENKEVYINFEGVDSCFYLYINGKFSAYSQVSHMTHEINITKLLCEGENEIKVVVFKWCDGSYLEDQDMWRMSGIFRDVYLLFREADRIKDVYIRTSLSYDFLDAQITADIEAENQEKLSWTLLSPSGTELASGTGGIKAKVERAELWSDEKPVLYKLILSYNGEYLGFDVGFRKIEIRNSVVYLNGKKIKFKGVNRHDSHPVLGHATPLSHMKEDIMIMKRHNVNAIRTSHYPNSPLFLSLCDKYGMLVIDEADLECHGIYVMGSMDYLSQHSQWREAFVDRARLMFERDKNRTCVVMWSLGNESGYGDNHRAMSIYIRSKDDSRLMHYEGANALGEKDYLSLESRMYSSPAQCIEYLENPSNNMPFFLCEYSHAMGNGPGDVGRYRELFYKYDNFLGGCVWEYTDHSVRIPVGNEGKYGFTYGGDFNDHPNDGEFCVDGLVYPDRRPHTGFLEVKQAYLPVDITEKDKANGVFSIKSLRCFESLEDIRLVWTVEKNGKLVAEGIYDPELNAGEQTDFVIELPENISGYCYINFSVRQKNSTPWAPKGYEMGLVQLVLCEEDDGSLICVPCSDCEICLEESSTKAIFTVGETKYVFSKTEGMLLDVVSNGASLLKEKSGISVWRAPMDNDRNIKWKWMRYKFHTAALSCYCAKAEMTEDGRGEFKVDLSLGGASMPPIAQIELTYTVSKNGVLNVSHKVKISESSDMPFLPRYGMTFVLDDENYTNRMQYFGMGPVESYQDKKLASRMGMFEKAVSENFEHYVKPQENSAHYNTKYAFVRHASGMGIKFICERGMSFNAQNYSTEDITSCKHDYELAPVQRCYVSIDYKQSGSGSNSCGPELDKAYRLDEKEFEFTFSLFPSFEF